MLDEPPVTPIRKASDGLWIARSCATGYGDEKASKEIAKCGGIRPRVVDAEVGPGLESTHVLMVDKKQIRTSYNLPDSKDQFHVQVVPLLHLQ